MARSATRPTRHWPACTNTPAGLVLPTVPMRFIRCASPSERLPPTATRVRRGLLRAICRCRFRHLPALRHLREVEERLLIVSSDGVFDLVVEAAAGLLGKGDVHLVGVTDGGALDILGERRFSGVALRVAAGEHLLEDAENVVSNQRATPSGAAELAHVRLELLQVVGVVGDVLTGVVAVTVDELGHLRLL